MARRKREHEDPYRELADLVLSDPAAMVMVGLAMQAKQEGGDEGFEEFMGACEAMLARESRARFRVVKGRGEADS